MEMVQNLLDWLQGIVDKIIEYFGYYTNNYSKYLVYALLLFIVSKMLKLKVDVKTGGK